MDISSIEFNLNIESGNAAIVENGGRDIARILKDVANQIEENGIANVEGLYLFDYNGNNVGEVELTVEEEDGETEVDPDGYITHGYEVSGFYGSEETPCTVFVAVDHEGGYWYAVENSVNVNCTHEDITDGVNVEELADHDCMTVNEGIMDVDRLVEHVAERLAE